MSRIRIIALITALFLLTSCSANKSKINNPADGTLSADIEAVSEISGETTEDGYILAASNENYSLYYEEKGLTVRLKNRRTGAVTESAAEPDEGSSETWKNFVNSGIVLEYYKGSAVNLNRVNMYSGNPEKKIYLIKDGFAAKISFKSIGILLTVFITLDGDGIRARIPNSSVKEENSEYRLAAVYVLPFLGYTRLGDTDGYMLIPDGCGAIIPLKDNNERFSQPYKAKLYGGNYTVEADKGSVQRFDNTVATTADTAPVFAPVFGMVHTESKTAFLGIIENGKYNAEIYAYPNGVTTDYNWITARYVYREVYLYLTGSSGSISTVEETRETFDISAYYRFTDGEEADYVGLAKAYRSYLSEHGLLNNGTDCGYGMRLDFFAGDVQKSLVGTSFVGMTSISEIDGILKELTQNGMNGLAVSLKGWQKGGIYGKLTGALKFEGSVGSLKEYKNLAQKYGGSAQFFLYADFLNVYGGKPAKNYIYQYNGKVFSNDTLLSIHSKKYRYTPDAAVKLTNAFISALGGDLGICFDGVTNEVYSYGSGEKGKVNSRKFSASVISESLALAGKKLSTAYNSPNDYLWNNAQRYYDYRIYGTDYKFVSDEVPFFAIVLRGSLPLYSEYINFKADTTEYLLKLIESGVYPSFLLTGEPPSKLINTDSASLFSCEYGEYKEMILKYDKIFCELSQVTGDGKIAFHSASDGVSVTTYENGAKVIVNYNSDNAEYEGNTLAGKSYLFLKGKAEGK